MRNKVALIICAIIFWVNCTKQIPVSYVVNEDGKPVSGSIFYIEARSSYNDSRVYDFTYNTVGPTGEILQKQLAVRNSLGRYTKALFYAPGKVPFIMDSVRGDFLEKNSIQVKLDDPLEVDLSYNLQVFELAFPFEDQPDLRKRLYDEKYRPLREAFMAMYKQERLRLYELNTESLKKLKRSDVPIHIRKKIRDILGTCKVKYFPWLVEKALGKRDADKYFSLVLSSAKKITDGYSDEELKKIRSLEKLEEEIRRERGGSR